MKNKWKRPGYTVLAVRVRDEVIERVDDEVRALRERALKGGLGEPRMATRTTVVLEALASHLNLGGEE
jgi:hypothetical protein